MIYICYTFWMPLVFNSAMKSSLISFLHYFSVVFSTFLCQIYYILCIVANKTQGATIHNSYIITQLEVENNILLSSVGIKHWLPAYLHIVSANHYLSDLKAGMEISAFWMLHALAVSYSVTGIIVKSDQAWVNRVTQSQYYHELSLHSLLDGSWL